MMKTIRDKKIPMTADFAGRPLKERLARTFRASVPIALTAIGVGLGGRVCAADAVEWPDDYESKLAAHIAALKPSGDQSAQSAAFAYFDSVGSVDLLATLSDLRNYAKPGFLLFLR